jgi:hypothetical protein
VNHNDLPVNHDDTLIRRLVAGDDAGLRDVLTRMSRSARTTRDRQLVAIAAAHLDGDADLFGALVRDHLVDHPDSHLAAWIATQQAGPAGTDPQE